MNNNAIIPGLESFTKPTKVGSKGKQKVQQIVGNQTFINETTGEVEEFMVIQKNINKDYGFHKIWLEDLMNILNTMGNRKMTILSYLLSIMRESDNTFTMTMRSLSEDTGVSLPTCHSTITELLESNVIKRDTRIKQLYTFNPDLLAKGGANRRKKILIEYNFEDEQKDISNKIKNVKEILNEKLPEEKPIEYIEIKKKK
jgi:DNA-binding Lrp family transcriptional regulator